MGHQVFREVTTNCGLRVSRGETGTEPAEKRARTTGIIAGLRLKLPFSGCRHAFAHFLLTGQDFTPKWETPADMYIAPLRTHQRLGPHSELVHACMV